jgi:hypothetical protein
MAFLHRFSVQFSSIQFSPRISQSPTGCACSKTLRHILASLMLETPASMFSYAATAPHYLYIVVRYTYLARNTAQISLLSLHLAIMPRLRRVSAVCLVLASLTTRIIALFVVQRVSRSSRWYPREPRGVAPSLISSQLLAYWASFVSCLLLPDVCFVVL